MWSDTPLTPALSPRSSVGEGRSEVLPMSPAERRGGSLPRLITASSERGFPVREEGVVIGVDGDKARVRIERSDACSRCRVCVQMGNGSMVIGAKNVIGSGVGERVSVEIDDSRHLRAAFMVFILPLAGLLVGCLMGLAFTGSEKIGCLTGAGMSILVFMVLRWCDRKIGTRDQSWPRIVGSKNTSPRGPLGR